MPCPRWDSKLNSRPCNDRASAKTSGIRSSPEPVEDDPKLRLWTMCTHPDFTSCRRSNQKTALSDEWVRSSSRYHEVPRRKTLLCSDSPTRKNYAAGQTGLASFGSLLAVTKPGPPKLMPLFTLVLRTRPALVRCSWRSSSTMGCQSSIGGTPGSHSG